MKEEERTHKEILQGLSGEGFFYLPDALNAVRGVVGAEGVRKVLLKGEE